MLPRDCGSKLVLLKDIGAVAASSYYRLIALAAWRQVKTYIQFYLPMYKADVSVDILERLFPEAGPGLFI